MKNKDVDKFREKLNNDIDGIIENDECKEERVKPSHILLTVSIVCLVFVFGYIKGLCILIFVLGCIWFSVDEIKPSNKSKKKKDTHLAEDEFE